MKKQKNTQKLVLSRETLCNLQVLGPIQGGTIPVTTQCQETETFCTFDTCTNCREPTLGCPATCLC